MKIVVLLLLLIILHELMLKPYIYPKIGFSLYQPKTVIDYFEENKDDFQYIVDHVQDKGLSSIRMDEGELVFSVRDITQSLHVIKKESLYEGDGALKQACNNLLNGFITVKVIWVDEYELYRKTPNDVKLKIIFEIDSKKFSSHSQAIVYVENIEPAPSGAKTVITNLEGNWYYIEEDQVWDNSTGG